MSRTIFLCPKCGDTKETRDCACGEPLIRSTDGLGVRRFPNVYMALDDLRRSQNPAFQSEAQIATDILWGKRPGIEEKYDALLLKLDRSYSNLTDKRDHWKKVAEESPLARTRQFAKAKVAALNILLTDLQWMKARNRDLIAAVASTPNDTLCCEAGQKDAR